MKKILVLLLAVLTLIAFVACDTGNGSSSPVGTGTESESGTGTGSTGSEGGNTGSGTTGGSTGSEGGNTGSGTTGGSTGSEGGNTGSGSTGGTGSGSTGGNISYVGTWTVTMGSDQMSVTLNTDGTCVAYNSDEGFAEAIWNVTNSGVTITIPGVGSLDGNLENGKLVVNYMGQDVSMTKVDTAAYVGTWTGSMGGATLSITLNADGTMFGYSPIMEPTDIDGFWTVTNDGVMIGADVGDVDPEEGIIPGSLQGDKLVINFNGQIELTK